MSYRDKENRSLDIVEKEFAYFLENKDKDNIISLLQERSDIPVFFCSVAIIKKQSHVLRSLINDLPEDIKFMAPLITRMTKPSKNVFIAAE
jgi:hypothetical protein